MQKSKNNIIAAIEQGIITPTTKDRLQELEHLESDLQVKIATEKKAENKNLTAPEIEKFLKNTAPAICKMKHSALSSLIHS